MNFDYPYNPDDFARFISDFLPDDFMPIEQGIDYQASYIQKAKRLGACKSLELEVFEVLHNSTHDARVGLSREAVKMLQHHSYCNRALIAFAPTDNSRQWRFSLLHIELEQQDHSARLTRIPSNPRRYSFLLGEGSKVKTPQQFLRNEGSIRAQRRGNKDFTVWDDLCYRFSVEVLTKEFYKELSEWYEWAKKNVAYPNNKDIEEHLIRLVTRLMFVWFIKQNDLIPETIFDINELQTLLNDFNPFSQTEGNYYNAILQNLFFATLNCPINERKFTAQSTVGAADGKEHYGIKIFFRDNNQKTWFNQSHEEILKVFRKAPFLNGGLFECLDKKPADANKIVYNDGFSRDERNKQGQLIRAFIPNCLFFDREKGLISILQKYNFTIEENTPNDVDIALDPELLGKVFENLLGAYNPETKETARKQSGSFYTPREIVNYMVDESLIAYLKEKVGEQHEDDYRKLLVGESEMPDTVKSQIYDVLRKCKILDPACGSGAFPMGILNRIIIIMEHLGLPSYISIFDLKRYLIENCIFGIDIQPIAIQISKLRFFISLIVEQKPTDNADDNYGIKPLPNLETKFVAANTLIGINKNKTDWNPYDQNGKSPFFDADWMFNIKDGFDIVIGNPPYGATTGAKDNYYFKKNFVSAKTIKNVQKGSLDTFTLFIERGHQACKLYGSLHYIVPISITSSEAMTGLHNLLESSCSLIKVSSYAVRPHPVFENAVVNTSILFFQKDGKQNEKILATKMYRKNKNFNLQYLIDNLQFIDVKDVKLVGRYPKISYEIEKSILRKIFAQDLNIGNLIQEKGKPIWIRFAGGRYFKVITNYSTNSSAERAIYFDKKIANSIGAILSSNLYFWFYQIFSDNLNLKNYEIESFGFPNLSDVAIQNLENIYSDYLIDIERNSNIRRTERYANIDSFKEYKIGKSKHLIDQIDDIICPLYGLSQKETDFIKNYEIEFRLSAGRGRDVRRK